MDTSSNPLEPGFLAALRLEAARQAATLPLPDRASHRWRYTAPAQLLPGGRIPQPETGMGGAQPEILLDDAAIAAGVQGITFPEALLRLPDLVEAHLGRLAGATDPHLAYNLAAFRTGAVLILPDRVHLTTPIRIRHTLASMPPDQLQAIRVLVVAGPRSEASVISEFDQTDGCASLVSEVFVGEGASLVFASIEANASGATHTRFEGHVGERASLTHLHVLAPGGVGKAEVRVNMAGSHAAVEGLSLLLAGQTSQADYRVLEDHAAALSTSRVLVRAVGNGKGRAAFTGLLRVHADTPGCEAYEEARALLLSPDSEANLIPELEILNHDVACSHAAAVSPLDAEARYYLMTRGLTAQEAETMLVEGFAQPVLGRIPDPALAARVHERLLADTART